MEAKDAAVGSFNIAAILKANMQDILSVSSSSEIQLTDLLKKIETYEVLNQHVVPSANVAVWKKNNDNRNLSAKTLHSIWTVNVDGITMYSAPDLMPFIGLNRDMARHVVPEACSKYAYVKATAPTSCGDRELIFVSYAGLLHLLIEGRCQNKMERKKQKRGRKSSYVPFCDVPWVIEEVDKYIQMGVSSNQKIKANLDGIGDRDNMIKELEAMTRKCEEFAAEKNKLQERINMLEENQQKSTESQQQLQSQLDEVNTKYVDQTHVLEDQEAKLVRYDEEGKQMHKEMELKDQAINAERKRKMEFEDVMTGKRRRVSSLWSAFEDKDNLHANSTRNDYGVVNVYRQAMSVIVDTNIRSLHVGLNDLLLHRYGNAKMNDDIRADLYQIIPELTGEPREHWEAHGGKQEVDAVKTFRNPIQMMAPIRNSLKRANHLVNSSVEINIDCLLKCVTRYNKFAVKNNVRPIFVQDELWMVLAQTCNGLEFAEKLRKADEAVSQEQALELPRPKQRKMEDFFLPAVNNVTNRRVYPDEEEDEEEEEQEQDQEPSGDEDTETDRDE